MSVPLERRAARPAWPQQPKGFDLLRLPGLRRFFRWRYARLTLQLPLLLLAVFAVFDGLTGDQLAPRNIATTTLWLHYRGLVVLALAVVGNAFCAACPLMLTRGLSRRLERLLPRKLNWPRALKNKYLVIALLLAFFFLLRGLRPVGEPVPDGLAGRGLLRRGVGGRHALPGGNLLPLRLPARQL